ncbi:MAG: histidine kinase [Thermodesulfobacteriota bacterium]
MPAFPQTAGWGGLKFFGRISASISHELKNALSIVNENAGLLEDLALLADSKGGLDIERVKALSASIGRQVKRADNIIRNMNKFAHTVDFEIKTFDLQEYLELTAAVSARLLAAKSMTLKVIPAGQQVSLTTSPFFLLYLIWHLLDCCSQWPGPEKSLDVSFSRDGGVISICFKGCMTQEPGFMTQVMDGDSQALLTLLGANIAPGTRPHEMEVHIPETPPGV